MFVLSMSSVLFVIIICITEINRNTNYAIYRKYNKELKYLSKKYVNGDNFWLDMR